MVAIEFMEVGVSTVSKAAMTKGMSQFIFILYSNAFAAIFVLLPFSFFFYWKRSRPQLTVPIIFKILLLSVLSCSIQTFLNTGIRHSSPTLCTAIVDLTPAFTFFLAIISRMEKLDFSLPSSPAKLIGTIVSVAGALIVTLYEGRPIASLPSLNEPLQFHQSNWVIGGIFCAAGAFCLALFFIVQTWILKDYPAELMVTVITCIFVTVLSAVISLIVEKDPDAWTLKPDVELIAIGCSAVFAVSLRSLVHAWACLKKGPLYTAMFKPLGMVIATFMGVSFLGDTFILESIVIAFGFYTVIWGKAQGEKIAEDKGNSNSSRALIKTLFSKGKL